MWGAPISHKVRSLYWQSQCMSFEWPTGQIVLGNSFAKDGSELVPPAWTRLSGLISSSDLISKGTLYLHERTSPGGRRMLVAIDVFAYGDWCFGDGRTAHVVARSIAPGGLFSRAVEVSSSEGVFDFYKVLEVRAGQSSESDHSHFTVSWKSTVGEFLIDGWLLDDGSIKLEPRDEPVVDVTSTVTP
jgi:hypothetical protein